MNRATPQPSMAAMRSLLVSMLVFAGCAPRVVPAPAATLPAAHPGSQFVVHAVEEASHFAEADLVTRDASLEALGLVVFRSDEDVAAAGHTLSAPVDFSRWVLVSSRSASPRLMPIPSSFRWLEAADRRIEVRIGNPCAGICGGASIVQLHVQECQMAHLADAYLVPRPVAELRIVRVLDRACDPRLP